MGRKGKGKAPVPDWNPTDDMPVDNPYPEFEDELFEGVHASGIKPEQVTEPDRTKYMAWLAARAKRS